MNSSELCRFWAAYTMITVWLSEGHPLRGDASLARPDRVASRCSAKTNCAYAREQKLAFQMSASERKQKERLGPSEAGFNHQSDGDTRSAWHLPGRENPSQHPQIPSKPALSLSDPEGSHHMSDLPNVK